jgi:hypothetical protein
MATVESECVHQWIASPIPVASYCPRCGAVRLGRRRIHHVGSLGARIEQRRRDVPNGLLRRSAPIALALIATIAAVGLLQQRPGGAGPSRVPAAAGYQATPPLTRESMSPAAISPSPQPTPTAPPGVPVLELNVALAASGPLRSTAVPIRLRWQGAKGKGGWPQLQLAQDAGSFRLTQPTNISATGARLVVEIGHRYRLRGRTRQADGDWSGWSAERRFLLREVGERTSTLQGRWAMAGYAAYSDGVAAYSRNRGDELSFAFRGSVAWVGPRGPGRGVADVFVDGALVASVDTGAAHFSPRQVLFAYTARDSGSHRVVIRVRGSPGRPMVAVDGFVLLEPD